MKTEFSNVNVHLRNDSIQGQGKLHQRLTYHAAALPAALLTSFICCLFVTSTTYGSARPSQNMADFSSSNGAYALTHIHMVIIRTFSAKNSQLYGWEGTGTRQRMPSTLQQPWVRSQHADQSLMRLSRVQGGSGTNVPWYDVLYSQVRDYLLMRIGAGWERTESLILGSVHKCHLTCCPHRETANVGCSSSCYLFCASQHMCMCTVRHLTSR